MRQAAALPQFLHDAPIRQIVSSPLTRCLETAAPLADARGIAVGEDERVGECHYGAWTGRRLSELATEPLWKTVQTQPSAVVFPSSPTYRHESMSAMQQRAVEAVRQIAHDADETENGPDHTGVVAVFSHGDVIKAILADAAGTHLDAFQRIVVSPASISVIQYTDERPYVIATNVTSGGIGALLPSGARRDTGAVVGGDAT